MFDTSRSLISASKENPWRQRLNLLRSIAEPVSSLTTATDYACTKLNMLPPRVQHEIASSTRTHILFIIRPSIPPENIPSRRRCAESHQRFTLIFRVGNLFYTT